MKIIWGSTQDVINVSQAGQKSSEIVLMRIWAWAFHLDNNTFKVGCKGKDSPDCLGDHVTTGSCPRTAVPVCAIILQLRPCCTRCQGLMRKEEGAGRFLDEALVTSESKVSPHTTSHREMRGESQAPKLNP